MPRINIELPAAWGTPSSVMTDISNNRLSLYILHEPTPQRMALCCTLLVSFGGWKLKSNPIPPGREVFRGWNTEFPLLDLSGLCMQTVEGPGQVIFCPSHN